MQPQMSAAEIMQLELQLAGRDFPARIRLRRQHAGRGAAGEEDRQRRQRPAWLAEVEGKISRARRSTSRLITPISARRRSGGIPPTTAFWPNGRAIMWASGGSLGEAPTRCWSTGAFGSPACFSQSSTASPTACCCSRFFDRPHYHVVLRHVDVLARVDTLAVMRAKQQVDGKAVLHDLFDHFLVPD